MGTSKHRKNHKQRVQAHKQQVQDKRYSFQKLVDQLEVEMLKIQMTKDLPTVDVEQPTLKITGQ